MKISAGVRLGSYEVIALIGVGGMGEVYRARDTKLNRDVALKVLPELFAADPERLARFKREAQVLASLNHPNIAAIYGLEESDGIRALVLELVEGPTLAEVLAGVAGSRGPGLRTGVGVASDFSRTRVVRLKPDATYREDLAYRSMRRCRLCGKSLTRSKRRTSWVSSIAI